MNILKMIEKVLGRGIKRYSRWIIPASLCLFCFCNFSYAGMGLIQGTTTLGFQPLNENYYVSMSTAQRDKLPQSAVGTATYYFISPQDTNDYYIVKINCSASTPTIFEVYKGDATTSSHIIANLIFGANVGAYNRTESETFIIPYYIPAGTGLWMFSDKSTATDPDEIITMRLLKKVK